MRDTKLSFSMMQVTRRAKTRPRLKHTSKPLSISSVHQYSNFDDCRVRKCGPHGTCVDCVNSYSCDCDPGFQETDIDEEKVCENLDGFSLDGTANPVLIDWFRNL